MNFTKLTYSNDMEILITDANLVTFSGTVLAANVTTTEENGKKYVLAGSLIDVNGNLIKQTGAETLSTIPAGVLYKTVDVTNGDESGALIVEGYVRADRVLDGFADKAKDEIKKALPGIKFR